MGKIGLIVDSSSGFTRKEIEDKGFGFIPLNIIVNGKVYRAGVDINSKEVYEKMSDKNIKMGTSTATGESIIRAFDKVLENYDEAIFIGLSHKFSGNINAVKNVAQNNSKYKNKIHIYDSEYCSPWLSFYFKEFEKLIMEYDDVNEIMRILDLPKKYICGFLTPGDIWWFYNGGRITKLQYMMGSLMKINPILTVADGEIKKDQLSRARTQEKTLNKMGDLVLEVINKIKKENLKFKIVVVKSSIEELTNKAADFIKNKLNISNEDIVKLELSSEQASHLGPGSFGFGTFVTLEELIKKGK
ncbi:MAG: fatty acid-binding protein DegV [Candidatus Tyloplasma litorale]|nr:MAG: fatty acid-binding protein DegV [Mycoplasmatales bacterium]